jgi:hypothetical protein
MVTNLFIGFPDYKFDKNSHLIMKPCNFAVVMESVRRIFFCLLPLLFCSISGFNAPATIPGLNDLNPFEKNGKVGLKNQKGDIVIPAQYDALGWSDGSFSVVENVTGYALNGQWGLVNLTNHKVTKPEFLDLTPGDGSTMIVARKKLPNSVHVQTGCIGPNGKTLIPFQYDGIRFTNLRAIVFRKENTRFKHGLINFANEVIIPLNYQAIYPLGSLRFAVVSFENKTAIFTETGEQLSAFSIDSISSFNNNFAVIYQDRRQGLINREGRTVLEPAFREIRIMEDGTVRTRKGDDWSFLDGNNTLIRHLDADLVEPIARDLYKVGLSGNYQLTDKNFRPLNSLYFSDIGPFKNGTSIFTAGNKKGLIRQDGHLVLPAKYIELIEEGKLLRASELTTSGLRWLLIDTAGNAITQKNYQYIAPCNGGFFPAKHRGFWGALDEHGKEVVACVHDSLVQQTNDHIVVKFKGGYGIINAREEWVITPQRNKLRLVDGQRFIELAPPHQFLKSFSGEVIYFTENFFAIHHDHLLEYLPSGEVWKVQMNGVISERFTPQERIEKIYNESEGYRAIKKDGKFGFIDNRARLRIANRYEDVQDFSEGLAGAKILGKWGFVSKDDRIAIQPVYDEVFPFRNGFAMVRQKNSFGVIDHSGKVILPVRYEHIEILEGNLIRLKQNGRFGLADTTGKVLLNSKYDNVRPVNDRYFIIERDGKSGVVTSTGMSTIPLIYDSITFDPYNDQFVAVKRAEWATAKF